MPLKNRLTALKSVLGLSLSLARANFRLRVEGSYLGLFWYFLEPLLFFLIILGIRGFVRGAGIPQYPMYLLVGLVVFNFFRGATVQAAKAVTANAEFVKSMKIPKESLVIAVLLQFLFSHLFEMMIVAVFSLYYGLPLTWIFFYPALLAILSIFTLGASFLLAAVGVFILDLPNVWNVFVRALWFLTPIFYIIDKKTAVYCLNLFNPMFYALAISRDVIVYSRAPQPWMVSALAAFSAVSLVCGLAVFEKYKNRFAELV